MKFKMSEKSLFATLLRSPWWVSFLVMLGVAVGLAVEEADPVEEGVREEDEVGDGDGVLLSAAAC